MNNYEKLEQARYQDCYHKALIYILGTSEDTRNHFSQIYDMKSGFIKPECLHQGWLYLQKNDKRKEDSIL